MSYYFHWSRPGNDTVQIPILPRIKESGWAIVERYPSQNRLRHVLSTLYRTKSGGRYSVLPDTYYFRIVMNGSEYELWVSTQYHAGQASYLAGILLGKQHKWTKAQRRTRRKHKRRAAK